MGFQILSPIPLFIVMKIWLDAKTYELGYFQDNGNCDESLRIQSASPTLSLYFM